MLNVNPDSHDDGDEPHPFRIPTIKTANIHGHPPDELKLHINPSPTTAENSFETSVWCEGDKLQNRRCTFKNVCFQPR
jgi:hypothetical protein